MLTANESRIYREYENRREADELGPIRFAAEDAPLCRRCDEVDVSDEGELCAECLNDEVEARAEDYYEHRREMAEGK